MWPLLLACTKPVPHDTQDTVVDTACTGTLAFDANPMDGDTPCTDCPTGFLGLQGRVYDPCPGDGPSDWETRTGCIVDTFTVDQADRLVFQVFPECDQALTTWEIGDHVYEEPAPEELWPGDYVLKVVFSDTDGAQAETRFTVR